MKNYPGDNLTPLNLPKRETSDSFSNESSAHHSPPLEGLGEVKKEYVVNIIYYYSNI
jgi:hypothetical protein